MGICDNKLFGGEKKGFIEKVKEKLNMYDMIIANIIAGKSIIEPDKKLDNTEIAIGFSNIASESTITKYFIIRQFPDYLSPRLIDLVRSRCVTRGVKINFYFYIEPYKIDWNSAEMKNKMAIWKRYYRETSGNVDVFEYRNKRDASLARERIALSVKYLNEAELEHKRSLARAFFLIEVSAYRDEESIINMIESIKLLKSLCSQYDIRLQELRVNLIDWIQELGVFSLRTIKEVHSRITRKILTDDLLANFNSYKQGRVGTDGVCLGIDVLSNVPVLKKFKADPDAAENWLIAAETQGGKSYFVKALITYLLADNFVVTVMDYEGDEYNNLANYVRAGNPDDVKIISMGKGSTVYFDPMEIPDLTGDPDIDNELKETAISYTLAIFRVIVAGLNGTLSQWEEKVISMAIQRVYESVGVTEDKRTWKRSKGLRLYMVYEEIKDMVENKELVDFDSDNVKHKAALRILEAASVYFEEGGAKYGTFEKPLSINDLYKAKLIIFSFGMRGAANSISDQTVLALKQLSVACISTQISNYCKYVKKCFNVKVWEEFQRWKQIQGSSEIILNAMTGGRKRGDVNILITNNLVDILDEDDPVASGIRQNIQNIAVGRIRDKATRRQFCEVFGVPEIEPILDRIARAYSNENTAGKVDYENRYKHAFCLLLDNGKRVVTKVMLPPALVKSSIFRTGVDKKE